MGLNMRQQVIQTLLKQASPGIGKLPSAFGTSQSNSFRALKSKAEQDAQSMISSAGRKYQETVDKYPGLDYALPITGGLAGGYMGMDYFNPEASTGTKVLSGLGLAGLAALLLKGYKANYAENPESSKHWFNSMPTANATFQDDAENRMKLYKRFGAA
jgi:hypothetical protein